MPKSPRPARLTKDEKEDRKWAATEIVPWAYSPTPGPSHDQWMQWNNEHGAALRLACAAMLRRSGDSRQGTIPGSMGLPVSFDSAVPTARRHQLGSAPGDRPWSRFRCDRGLSRFQINS
jgi:hypothetical protein